VHDAGRDRRKIVGKLRVKNWSS